MVISRTVFKNEIIAEFGFPTRTSKKVIVFCKGMPGSPSGRAVLEFYTKKGFTTFLPRYRGTWESRGTFLKNSPHEDVIDLIDQLPKGFKDLWNKKIIKVNPQKIYIFGASFGGPAALLASLDQRVAKVVAAAPVIDWKKQGKTEPLGWLENFTTEAFGEAYRFSHRDWQKLKKGKFYNPWHIREKIPGEKALLFHAQDDDVVPWGSTKNFALATGAKLVSFKRGGHYGVSNFVEPQFYRHIKKHLAI